MRRVGHTSPWACLATSEVRPGNRISSTSSCITGDGLVVTFYTAIVTMKLMIIPIVPKPVSAIPKRPSELP